MKELKSKGKTFRFIPALRRSQRVFLGKKSATCIRWSVSQEAFVRHLLYARYWPRVWGKNPSKSGASPYCVEVHTPVEEAKSKRQLKRES